MIVMYICIFVNVVLSVLLKRVIVKYNELFVFFMLKKKSIWVKSYKMFN